MEIDREVKAIEYLVEYTISKKEFDELDPDLAAASAIVSYAYSEINTLMRLYLFSCHDLIDDDVIDSLNFMQRQVLLRTWSAKLFEFADFLELKKYSKTNNEILKELAKSARKSFEKLKADSAYKTVRSIRHEATNHYALSPAKKNLEHIGKSPSLSLYMHKVGGNSFFPLGEEVMFVGRMNRAAGKGSSKEEIHEAYKKWLDWNLQATQWLNNVHSQFMNKILLEKFPDRKALRRNYWIPMDMVGEVGEIKTPLFVRSDEYLKAKNKTTA